MKTIIYKAPTLAQLREAMLNRDPETTSPLDAVVAEFEATSADAFLERYTDSVGNSASSGNAMSSVGDSASSGNTGNTLGSSWEVCEESKKEIDLHNEQFLGQL